MSGLSFFWPAHGAEQEAQVVVASGQLLTELRPGGEVGGQLLLQGERVGMGGFRFFWPARVAEQVAQVVVAMGQLLKELGPGGEVGRQLLPEGKRVGMGRL